MRLIKGIKKFFKQTKQKKTLKGNTSTRSKAKHVSMPRGIEYNFRNESTKFYLRPPSFENKSKWKKYVTPHVWPNDPRLNKSGLVQVRKFYADGEVMPFISGKAV